MGHQCGLGEDSSQAVVSLWLLASVGSGESSQKQSGHWEGAGEKVAATEPSLSPAKGTITDSQSNPDSYREPPPGLALSPSKPPLDEQFPRQHEEKVATNPTQRRPIPGPAGVLCLLSARQAPFQTLP